MTILHVPAEPVYPVALSAFQKLKYAIQIRLFKFMVKSFFRRYSRVHLSQGLLWEAKIYN